MNDVKAAIASVMLVVATARAEPARCVKGLDYARKNDLPHAALYLAGCDEAEVAKLDKRLKASQLASLELIGHPDGLIATTDALPGEAIVLPATIWIPAGRYTVSVVVGDVTLQNAIEVKPRSRGTSLFTAPPKIAPKTEPETVDFGDEPGGEPTDRQVGSPVDLKHPPLTPDKYRGVTSASGPPIDDPLEIHPVPRADRGWSIGARLGGGMFDDRLATAHAGLAIAAVGRVVLARSGASPTWFVDGRLDWSRRGVDTFGVTPLVGLTVLDHAAAAISVTLGPRLETRLVTSHDGMAVARFGGQLVVGCDIALAQAPIVAGLRVERGLHDTAVIVELGFDWHP